MTSGCAIIEKAITIIEDKGWIQGSIGTDDNGYCVMGALDKAWHQLGSYGGALAISDAKNSILHEINKDRSNEKIFSLSYWNDSSARTKEEVLSKMRAACE